MMHPYRECPESLFFGLCQLRSADELSHKLEEKFREEEALGRMYPTTLGALRT